jgi:hypothetical protein
MTSEKPKSTLPARDETSVIILDDGGVWIEQTDRMGNDSSVSFLARDIPWLIQKLRTAYANRRTGG